MKQAWLAASFVLLAFDAAAQVDQLASQVEHKVIAWRRDIHANPELGNREFRTSKLVADHLRSLGMEVEPRPMSQGTPFANVLLVAQRRPEPA